MSFERQTVPAPAVPPSSFSPLARPGLQRKIANQANDRTSIPSIVHEVLRSPGQPLDPVTRAFMEPRFGHDFSQVRVHSDERAAESARAVNALAYAVGPNVVFETGRYRPETADGRSLLAHELAHVRQQSSQVFSPGTALCLAPPLDVGEEQADLAAESVAAGYAAGTEAGGGQQRSPLLRRQTAGTAEAASPGAATAAPAKEVAPSEAKGVGLNDAEFAAIADQIYKAINGPGTDEEAVYRALQRLERDPDAIKELKRVYSQRHDQVKLLDDIEGDFEGTEREYALQLLNMGDKGAAQRIAAAPESPQAAAQRIYEAVSWPGTDEEAVFAALLPFRRNTLRLKRAYQEAFDEDLHDRIEAEMSGGELEYALDLLATPFEQYVQEASSWLESCPAIGFGLPWNQEGWYDDRFWKREFVAHRDPEKAEWKLVLHSGEPHQAIDALFHEQGRWHVDCAVFVEVVQLYALRQSLGATRFNQRVGGRMELRTHGSSGVQRRALFKRASAGEAFKGGAASAEEVLADAPIGSRVRWTSQLLFDKANNLFGPEVWTIQQEEWPNWQHENTVKVGPDRYGAHGIGGRVSRATIEDEMAAITGKVFPDKPDSEIRAGIFISEIEIFENPEVSGQITASAKNAEKGGRP